MLPPQNKTCEKLSENKGCPGLDPGSNGQSLPATSFSRTDSLSEGRANFVPFDYRPGLSARSGLCVAGRLRGAGRRR